MLQPPSDGIDLPRRVCNDPQSKAVVQEIITVGLAVAQPDRLNGIGAAAMAPAE